MELEGVSRLFLSADLVGSTARKQQNAATWLGDVLAFYQRFPALFLDGLDVETESFSHRGNFRDPSVKLWKAVGDELIFTSEIRHEHQARVVVRAFLAAMKAWSEDVLNGSKSPMDLKGGAWIATFPHPDREVAVVANPRELETAVFDPGFEPEVNNRKILAAINERGEGANLWVDYLGPSMDTGFRVLKEATRRRFTVSLEVAWLMAASGAVSRAPKDLFLAGEFEMRGVWGGRGYPLFWLDTGNQHPGQQRLDKIMGTDVVDFDEVRGLAKNLCCEKAEWPTRLYLPDSTDPELRVHHGEVEEAIERLRGIDDTSGDMPDLDG